MIEVEVMKLFLAHYRSDKARLFRRQIIDRHMQDLHGGVHHVKAGIKGQCDIYGIIKGGKCFEIEVKNVKGKLSEEQINWRNFCALWQIPYLELRMSKGESVAQTVNRWTIELDCFLGDL